MTHVTAPDGDNVRGLWQCSEVIGAHLKIETKENEFRGLSTQ
jgi:hypothetical protein